MPSSTTLHTPLLVRKRNTLQETTRERSAIMSRHRNMKHLIAEEEDYYDDDYYDDHDAYDDYVAPPRQQTSSKAKQQQQQQAKAKQQIKKAQPPPVSPAKKTATPHPLASPVPPLSSSSTKPPPATRSPPAILLPQTTTTTTTQEQQNQSPKRTPLTVVVLGHVDAGKSTVTGHLLYHSHSRNQQLYNNNNNNNTITTTAATNYAWLLDEDEQERAHGVTMDVATKTLATATRHHLVLLDAPGHSDYVPAMITGTAGADAALLCVDATDFATAFGSGQLREHATLARGLGVQQVLVVVTKMDLMRWDGERYRQICERLERFLTTQAGFGASKIRSVPVSALAGDNMFVAPQQAAAEWYKGPTLWQALDDFEVPQQQQQQNKALHKPARILLTDVLAEQGRGGVAVRIKVLQGWMKAGEAAVVLPVGDDARLTKFVSLSRNDDGDNNNSERSKYAAVGEVVDAVVNGVDITRLSTGNIVTRPDERPPLATKCRAKVWIMDGLTIPIIRGATAIFHMHHLDVPCHVSSILRTLQKDGTTPAKERPRALTANTQAVVELTLLTPICMEAFADCRALARFVLRRGGDSIAVGRIEHVLS